MIEFEENGRAIVLLEEDDLLPEEEADALGGEFLGHDRYEYLVQGDTDVYKPDGEPLLFYRPDVLDAAICEAAFSVLKKLRTTPTNRGMASGKNASGSIVNMVKSDGTISRTHVSNNSRPGLSVPATGVGGYPINKDGTASKTWQSLGAIGDKPYLVRTPEHEFVFENQRCVAVDGQPFNPQAPIYMNGRPFLQDGTLSKTVRMNDHSVSKSASDIIGAFDRYARFPYCRRTAFDLRKESPMTKVVPFIQIVDRVFGSNLPDRYENQRVWVSRTEQDWVIPGTAFSTVTVNNNYRTACHKDAGDLKEGFGVMAVLQAGEYSGGYLVFPRFRVAVDMRTLGVCCADVHEWHGNTAFVGKQGKYHRTSCVFYYRANMYKCGTAQQELDWVQNRQAGDPIWLHSRAEAFEAQGIATDVDASDGAVVYTGKPKEEEAE